jgi:Domain of unknown function (DUF4390)
MTDFFTHCFKNGWIRCALCLILVCTWLASPVAHAQSLTEITQLRVERSDEAWQLSAQLQFEMPSAVEDALLKGIPMVFVISADVLRERWYWWYDKKMLSMERNMRLAYQPLTRRWRLTTNTGAAASTGVGLALNQSFDTLAQAMAAIKRIVKWKIADVSELDGSAKYKVDFRFKLDLGQLPRPFQIGAIGQSDWDISAAVQVPLVAEGGK